MDRFKKLLAVLLIAAFLPSCASSPLAKEPSDAEINAEAAKAYAEVKAKSKMSTNAEWNAIVQRVAKRIAASSGENFQWEVVLIDSPEVNAWCMPGGKMAVYTGILPVLKTEGALAAVMGHEVAHATMRHGKKRYARAMSGSLAMAGIGIAAAVLGQAVCKSDLCRIGTAVGGLTGAFMVTFFDRKFSRGDESEADDVGQMYMAKAGYDPTESIHLWERMGAANAGKAPPEWMSTHPSDQSRQTALRASLPRAMAVYDQQPEKFAVGQPIPLKN